MRAAVSRVCWVMLIGFPYVGMAPSATAQVILSDDFNDNSLDGAKWYIQTPLGGSVSEQNQRIELSNRGYLVTQGQFNPANPGGIRLQARWTFSNASFPGHDFVQFVTRTNAVPSGSGAAEVTTGISFMINGNDFISITDRTNGIVLTSMIPLTVDDGDVFDVDIRDDGMNLLFLVQEIGGQGASAVASGTSALSSGVNRIAFYNREFNNGFPTLGYLDNVVVQAIPEPTSIVSLGAVVGAYGLWRRRRQ